MNKILVTGATGLIGGEIVRQLLAKDIPCRILIRDTAKVQEFGPEIEVVEGDFSQRESLAKALSGIEKIFLASYDVPEVVEQQANVIATAKQCGVRHIVRMSTIGTEEWKHLPIFHWHGICDRQLQQSGLAFTLLRPAWVMQNFITGVINDTIRLPVEDGVSGFVDARDIASVAVAAVTSDGHENEAYDLATEILNHYEIAEMLSHATGRPINYDAISADAYQQHMEAGGWSKPTMESMAAIYADIRNGQNCDAIVTDNVESVTGQPGISFQQFAMNYAGTIGVSV